MTAARAVVAVVAAVTFEVLVGTTGTATKIAIAATYQYKVVSDDLINNGQSWDFLGIDSIQNKSLLTALLHSKCINTL